jgi:hypothetical protein
MISRKAKTVAVENINHPEALARKSASASSRAITRTAS